MVTLPHRMRGFMSTKERFPRLDMTYGGRWALVPLRLVIGMGFMVHGWAKFSHGPSGFAKLLAQIGVPFPHATAWAVTWLELLGGLAMFLGAFVVAMSIPLILAMLVALFKVHLRYGFSSINTIGLTESGPLFGPPGYEINLLYITGLLLFCLCGAGPLSIDSLVARRGRIRRPGAFTPGGRTRS